jgi:hypothetical protein
VGGRRGVVGETAPHLQLAAEVAARLQRPGEHLAAAHALGLELEEAAQNDGAARPVFVDQMCVSLVERNLGVERGRRRLHRFIQAVRQDDVPAPRVDAGQPQLLDLDGGCLADLELTDVVLALGLVVASQDVERLAAQIVNLRIAGVMLEVVRALERGHGVVELTRGRRRARGVALRGRIARHLLEHLLQLAARLVELPVQQIIVRVLAQLLDVRRRQPQNSNHRPAPQHSETRVLQRSCPRDPGDLDGVFAVRAVDGHGGVTPSCSEVTTSPLRAALA